MSEDTNQQHITDRTGNDGQIHIISYKLQDHYQSAGCHFRDAERESSERGIPQAINHQYGHYGGREYLAEIVHHLWQWTVSK